MDQQNSQRWAERLKSEKMAKAKWQAKYMTEEEQQREAVAEQEAYNKMVERNAKPPQRRSERDCMEARLVNLDAELEAFGLEKPQPPQMTEREQLRQKIAERVAAARVRNHRITGDLSTEAMLQDIGPALWISTNPSYSQFRLSTTSQSTHVYDKSKGWNPQVDKQHFLKRDEFMMHCEKTLQLGEKGEQQSSMLHASPCATQANRHALTYCNVFCAARACSFPQWFHEIKWQDEQRS